MVKTHPIASYYLLACAISWAVQAPLALVALGLAPWELPASLHFGGALGPALAALIVTAATAGGVGLRDLLRRATCWRGGPGWLLFALLSPAACFLVAAAALALAGWGDSSGGFGVIAELPQLSWPVAWVVWTLTFGLGEELGWRGFMLPRLQRKRSAYGATLILGLLWAFWHLPTFFYNYGAFNPLALVAFTISLLAGAVVQTWLYNSTGGSILLPAVWHGALNTAIAGAPGAISGFTSACVIFGAVTIIRRYGPATLSPTGKHTL